MTDAVTDPNVLDLYVERIALDFDPLRTGLAAVDGARALLSIVRGRSYATPAEIAATTLTRLGEKAAPLAEEGKACHV